MSRPPNSQPYQTNTVCNGGLIDFQDNRPMYTEQVYGAPAVANLNAFTTQTNYPQYIAAQPVYNNNPAILYPNQLASQPMFANTPNAMPQPNMMYNNMTQTQVIAGPPSEVYAHGKVYKAVDENMTATGTTPMASPATLEKDTLDRDIQQHVAQKVQEFMSKTNKNNLGSAFVSDDFGDDAQFLKELKRLNNNMKSRGGRH